MSTALRSRFIAFDRAQLDEAGRTISASLSSETPVRRAGGVIEVLRHDVASIDLSRAKGGLPLLIGHDRAALPVGVIESVRLEGRRLVGQLRFSRSARGEEVLRDVKDGVLQNVSIAYSVEAEEPLDGGYAATRWTPHEGSIVSIPADHTVGIGRSATTQPTSHIRTEVAPKI